MSGRSLVRHAGVRSKGHKQSLVTFSCMSTATGTSSIGFAERRCTTGDDQVVVICLVLDGPLVWRVTLLSFCSFEFVRTSCQESRRARFALLEHLTMVPGSLDLKG